MPDTAASTPSRHFRSKGLREAVGFHRTRLPLVVLIGGIVGGASGFLLQYYAAAVSYPDQRGRQAAQ